MTTDVRERADAATEDEERVIVVLTVADQDRKSVV